MYIIQLQEFWVAAAPIIITPAESLASCIVFHTYKQNIFFFRVWSHPNPINIFVYLNETQEQVL